MRNTNPPMALSSLSRTLFLGAASNSSRSRVRNEVIKDRIFFSCPQWRISFKKHQKPIQCVFQTWKNHHFTLALQHLFGFPQNFMAFSPTFPLFDPPCSSQPYRPPPVPGPGDWSAAAGWGCESRCFRYPTRRSPSPVRIGVPQKAAKKSVMVCQMPWGSNVKTKKSLGQVGFCLGQVVSRTEKVQCGAPQWCERWFRFAPVTSSLFAYHKP